MLSAELALEILPEPSSKIRLVPAAFVEGIFAAVIAAAAGGEVDVVARGAAEALDAKAVQLDHTQLDHAQLDQAQSATDVEAQAIAWPAIVAEVTIVNADGIHARPAALIVESLASLDAQVMIATNRSAPVSARSPTALMSLGTPAVTYSGSRAMALVLPPGLIESWPLVRAGFGEHADSKAKSAAR